MNYLAHACLSFNNPQVLTGNLVSDFVKGKARYNFISGIQKGISLHRFIDQFTDAHPEITAAKQIFKKEYGLYSGAIVDVCMDFFLANNPSSFASENDLLHFTQQIYAMVAPYLEMCPQQFQLTFSKMKQYNWLFNYRFEWGIEKSLEGLVRRMKYRDNHQPAYRLFKLNRESLFNHFQIFYPQLQQQALRHYNENEKG